MAPLAIGDEAPNFDGLLGVDGRRYSLSSFAGTQVLVIIFSCNGCPTVKAAEDRLIAIQATYAPRGAQLLAINSNNSYLSPADTYPEMVTRASEKRFNFPYLKDEDRRVARTYGAVCTPHAFVFDHDRRLRYRGRIDDSRDAAKVTSRDLQRALEDTLTLKAVQVPETEPFGCAIVW